MAKSGYTDNRMESVLSRKIVISRGKITESLCSVAQGALYRIAGESSFDATTERPKSRTPERPFSRFVKNLLENQEPPTTSGSPTPSESKIAQDLLDATLAMDDPRFTFRFVWKDRNVTWSNSLRWRFEKSEATRLLEILFRSKSSKTPLRLRNFLHAPSSKEIASVTERITELSRILKGAAPLARGIYDVVLDPSVSAVLVHEIFGHPLEMDSLPRYVIPPLGQRFAPNGFSVFERAERPTDQLPGFDDEGIRVQDSVLVENGFCRNSIQSLESAFRSQSNPSGRARAATFRSPPIGRMLNIALLPVRNTPLAELMASVRNGIYVTGSLGAIERWGSIQIACQYGFYIRNGRLEQPFILPTIIGRTSELRMSLKTASSDFRWVQDGGCLSRDQYIENSGRGAPHLLLQNIKFQ